MTLPLSFRGILCLLCFLPASMVYSQVPSWTHFRGSHLDGISEETGIPVKWDDSTYIAWQKEIPGKGWSSPVVLGKQVWLTTATDRGYSMKALCLDAATGNTLFERQVFHPDSLYRIHAVNSYATPTPALEEGRVYVHFGRYGTACLDTRTGKTLWERTDLQCEHIQGPGSSLLIYRDLLIVHMEGADVQYILALDKFTGETVWRTDRPAELMDRLEPIGKKAYTTPIIVRVDGRDLMISNGSAACIAYDPLTGKEVWRIVQGEDSTIAMPTESDGIVFFYTSFVTAPDGSQQAELLAVDPLGKGDLGSTNVLWRLPTPRLQLLTPLVVNGLLFTIDSMGTLRCLDARTGKEYWSKKMKGKFNASPVYAGGNIYFSSTGGTVSVFKASKAEEQVAENRLDGSIWATPAIAGGALYIRTEHTLYKISGSSITGTPE
jgi:outer membrane protein assembly factor BamB